MAHSCSIKALPLRWQSIAAEVAQFCQPSGRTVRRQRHSSLAEAGELCQGGGKESSQVNFSFFD